MKNKYKVMLVKGVIALSAILSILFLFFTINVERMNVDNPIYKQQEQIALIIFSCLVVVVLIMVILMMKIDIRPPKTKSKKYKLKINNFDEFKNHLFNNLINDEYNEPNIFKGDLYNIEYLIKRRYRQSDIVLILKTKELTEEIYNQYTEGYFEEFGNYLLENGEIKVTDNINVIYIICVNKVTPIFSKYIESNVKQYFGRYNLPIGISLGSKTLYISVQKEGYARSRWKSLSKQFYKYVEELITNDKEH